MSGRCSSTAAMQLVGRRTPRRRPRSRRAAAARRCPRAPAGCRRRSRPGSLKPRQSRRRDGRSRSPALRGGPLVRCAAPRARRYARAEPRPTATTCHQTTVQLVRPEGSVVPHWPLRMRERAPTGGGACYAHAALPVAALTERSATDLARAIRAGELSAREVVEAHAWRLHRARSRAPMRWRATLRRGARRGRSRRRALRCRARGRAAALPGRAVHDQGSIALEGVPTAGLVARATCRDREASPAARRMLTPARSPWG